MSLIGLPEICRQLIAHGMPATTPCAFVQQGTTSNKHVVCGDLANLHALVAKAEFEAPTVTIIVDVVTLKVKLAWFSET